MLRLPATTRRSCLPARGHRRPSRHSHLSRHPTTPALPRQAWKRPAAYRSAAIGAASPPFQALRFSRANQSWKRTTHRAVGPGHHQQQQPAPGPPHAPTTAARKHSGNSATHRAAAAGPTPSGLSLLEKLGNSRAVRLRVQARFFGGGGRAAAAAAVRGRASRSASRGRWRPALVAAPAADPALTTKPAGGSVFPALRARYSRGLCCPKSLFLCELSTFSVYCLWKNIMCNIVAQYLIIL